MPFKLEDVDYDTDFAELIACEWASYENPYQPFFRLFCPVLGIGPNAHAESLKAAIARQLHWYSSEPSSYWQKVVDTDNGKIVAGALWKIHKTNPFDPPQDPHEAEWFPEGGAREYATKALSQFEAPRERMSQRPQVFLNIIFTHPDYRRRGIGDMILEWGIKKAEEMGVEMWLDATIYGVPLYKKHGFVVVHENLIAPQTDQPDDDWKKIENELSPMTFWQMWRPVGGKYIEGQTVKPWEE